MVFGGVFFSVASGIAERSTVVRRAAGCVMKNSVRKTKENYLKLNGET